MRPFYAVDLTFNPKNEQTNGREFLVDEPSAALLYSLERQFEEPETPPVSKQDHIIKYIWYASLLIGVTIALVISKSIGKDTEALKAFYAEKPWLFWLGGLSLITAAVTNTIKKQKRYKQRQQQKETEESFSVEAIAQKFYDDMDVPETAVDTELLYFQYTGRDETLKIVEHPKRRYTHENHCYKAYANSKKLFLVNTIGKYAFPLDSLRAIRIVHEESRIPHWHKEERYNKGRYIQYGIKHCKGRCVACPTYCVLELERDDQLWGITFPHYELPVFEELTGLKAQ